MKNPEPLVVETSRVDFVQSPDVLGAVLVQHGDRIWVGKGPILYVRGELVKKGEYGWLELTFREQETLADAIGRTGGLTPLANWKRVSGRTLRRIFDLCRPHDGEWPSAKGTGPDYSLPFVSRIAIGTTEVAVERTAFR